MPWTEIVGERFAPPEFERYVARLSFDAWRPEFVVVHNTAAPSIQQRPQGFTAAHMRNLVAYYRDQQEWRAGPHAFIDQNGIWVFTPLTAPGVHSPSWNAISWGIETLGNYAVEEFIDPIKEHLLACLTTLHGALGLDPFKLRFHKEDPKTDHDCPGRNMRKTALVGELSARLLALRKPEPIVTE